MKEYEEVETPTRTEKRLSRIICDFCERNVKHHLRNSYQISETKVTYRKGESFPESESGKEIEYDICGECFQSHLISFLDSLGAKAEWRGLN